MDSDSLMQADVDQPSREDWRDVMVLLDTALELDPAERLHWLDTLDPEHRRLRPMLTRLLHDHLRVVDSAFLEEAAGVSLGLAAAPPALAPQSLVGPYRLLREIGEGGMASVWLAERADGLLDRQVALKLPHMSWGSGSLAERMARERQILASLTHPNIARLYDVGIAADGRPFLALEYVDGQPIGTHAGAQASSVDERVALIVQVARAVAHAHAQLVVHRDLKPSNILVDAEGTVHLLDFGIAKLIEPPGHGAGESAPATLMVGRALTPDYASPEQIRGDPLGTASDIYSMGVVAFELLVGKRPYRLEAGLGPAAMAEAVARVAIPLASQAATDDVTRRALRGDLDAILARTLAKEPDARYASIDAFANDLERHLRGEPVAARGRPRLFLLRHLLKRHRWAVGAAALLVVSLAAGLVATLWQARRAEGERDAANRAVAREEVVRNELTTLFRNSAEQKGDAPMTARAMLDLSAKRVLNEYRDDPKLMGKVVMALADLYAALADSEGEATLLDSYLAQAAVVADADRESVALAEQELASVETIRGHLQHAAELLPKAEAMWASAPTQYRVQHLASMRYRGALLREQGDMDGAVRVYKTAIAECVADSGPDSETTADLYNSLGVTLQNAGRTDEALSAYQMAVDIDKRRGHGEDTESLILQGNMGLLDSQVGRLHEAEQVLKSVSDKLRARTGDSMGVAVYMGIYGSVLRDLGHPAEAAATLRTATDMASRFAGPSSPITMQSRLFLITALTESGQFAEARSLVATANAELARDQFPEAAFLPVRMRAASARIDLAAGHAEAAAAEYGALVEPLRKIGKPGLPLVAGALAGKAKALLAEGKAADAVAPLREAVALREQLGWGDRNWELAETRSLLGEALKRSHGPGGTALLQQSLAVMVAQLDPTHPAIVRARRALADAP